MGAWPAKSENRRKKVSDRTGQPGNLVMEFTKTQTIPPGPEPLAGGCGNCCSGGAQPAFGIGTDGFVALLSADLTQLIQSTYLGGAAYDYPYSIAISGGNVYVAGTTASINFPGTMGGAKPQPSGYHNGFVSRLSADLKSLVQSTFLSGNTGNDQAYSMAVSGGNVYVSGLACSTDFIGTSGGAQPGYGGGTSDAFVSRLSADLTEVIQSTYLGGSGSEVRSEDAWSMVISEGRVYIAGRTNSADFPGTSGGPQPEYGGGVEDAYVALLSADLKAVSAVTIDIKPGTYSNSINLKSKGKIPVAILSTKEFDAPSEVNQDQNFLTFGHTGEEKSLAFCNPHGEDINGDGLSDLVCHFLTQETEFECGDSEGILKGKTNEGTPIEGLDSISIVPCK